jgi:hypothetical protein
MNAHEQHIKGCYKIAVDEIKQHCKEIDQSFNESHEIMNGMVKDTLFDKGIVYPNELQRMSEYYSLWIDIKTCDKP